MSLPEVYNALRFTGLGGDLEVTEKVLPRPLPPNEVLVKVKVASINPVDIQLWRAGMVSVVSGDKGMGRDFSGTVVSVGKDVKGWTVGDDIFGLLMEVFGQGTFSEYIHFNPSTIPVAKKPDCFSHEAAASIPLVALTAYACLDWLPPPGTSQRKVVVRGASGGTGSWIVQLAKVAYDCHVTAICSNKNAEYVKSLGADEVIDYTTQDVLQTLTTTRASTQEYDLIIDCVGGTELLGSYQTLLHRKGGYITIVGDKSNVKTLGGPVTYVTHPAQIIRYIKGYIWGPRYACVAFDTKSPLLTEIVALGERGEVKVEVQEVIHDTFEGGWKRAVELIESTRIRGKVVLAIS